MSEVGLHKEVVGGLLSSLSVDCLFAMQLKSKSGSDGHIQL
jgi:hypothetical protein